MKGVVRTQEVQETDYTFDVALAKGKEFHS